MKWPPSHWGKRLALIPVCFGLGGCGHPPPLSSPERELLFHGEKEFYQIQQLTHRGKATHARGSFDNQWIVFQHRDHLIPGKKNTAPACDQIFKIRTDGTEVQRLSNGKDQSIDPDFLPSVQRILFSTPEQTQSTCPVPFDFGENSNRNFNPEYIIHGVRSDGTDILPLEPAGPLAYNAETATCINGAAVFTSNRDGNFQLYRTSFDKFGTFQEIQKITQGTGYHGLPAFSPDCLQLAWVESRPQPGRETERYETLLSHQEIEPLPMEIWVGNADGTHSHQVTHLGAISYAPTFTPDGDHILFASNFKPTLLQNRHPHSHHESHSPHSFELYLIHKNGTGLRAITNSRGYTSFPAFSKDGKYLIFSSNRRSKSPGEIKLMISRWNQMPDPLISVNDSQPSNRFLAFTNDLSAIAKQQIPMDPSLSRINQIHAVVNQISDRFSAIGLSTFSHAFHESLGGTSYQVPAEAFPLSKSNVRSTNRLIGVLGQNCKKKESILLVSSLPSLHEASFSGVATLMEVASLLHASEETQRSCYVFAVLPGVQRVESPETLQIFEFLRKFRIFPKVAISILNTDHMENNILYTSSLRSTKGQTALLNRECNQQRLTCVQEETNLSQAMTSDSESNGTPLPPRFIFSTSSIVGDPTKNTEGPVNTTGAIQTVDLIEAFVRRLNRE